MLFLLKSAIFNLKPWSSGNTGKWQTILIGKCHLSHLLRVISGMYTYHSGNVTYNGRVQCKILPLWYVYMYTYHSGNILHWTRPLYVTLPLWYVYMPDITRNKWERWHLPINMVCHLPVFPELHGFKLNIADFRRKSMRVCISYPAILVTCESTLTACQLPLLHTVVLHVERKRTLPVL